MQDAVTEENIQSVVAGFVEYMHHVGKTGNFQFTEMKNFMEPIFERAGYRQFNLTGGGNVLILHEGAAGDFITMSAAIREIRRIYPAAHITLVVEKNAANLAEHCPYVDELLIESFSLDGRLLMTLDWTKNIVEIYGLLLKVAMKLLGRRYDIAFAGNYGTIQTMPLLAYMSGARKNFSHYRPASVFAAVDGSRHSR